MTQAIVLPRSTPEAQGIDSAAITVFLKAVNQEIEHLNSIMLLRNGSVIAEGWWQPYQPEQAHMLYSLSKSFTSTAIGLAISEGLLSLDDMVLPFFPESAPAEISPYLRELKVRHLLSMSTGQEVEPLERNVRNNPDWASIFLDTPIVHPPGTFFLYNSAATYILSAMIQKLSGTTLLEYLRPRLLDPLGITEASWESCPRGINTGGWGLRITTDAIARFGQCYLQNGMWQGQQLIPADWVAEASSFQSDNSSNTNIDWMQGYGYQFWLCQHNCYRGDGAFGQYCVIMPEQQVVVAITSGLNDMQPVLNLIWQHLLPAFGKTRLPEDAAAQATLKQQLAKLSLPMPQGSFSSPIAAQISKKTYRCVPNPYEISEVMLEVDATQSILTLRGKHGEQQIAAGHGSWQRGTTRLYYVDPSEQPAAASAAWTREDSYTIRTYYTETPFSSTITCRFIDQELYLRDEQNVSFGPLLRAELHAKDEG